MMKTVYRNNMDTPFREKFIGVSNNISRLQKIVSHYIMGDIHNLYFLAPAKYFPFDTRNGFSKVI